MDKEIYDLVKEARKSFSQAMTLGKLLQIENKKPYNIKTLMGTCQITDTLFNDKILVMNAILSPNSIVPAHVNCSKKTFIVTYGALHVVYKDEDVLLELNSVYSVDPGISHALSSQGGAEVCIVICPPEKDML